MNSMLPYSLRSLAVLDEGLELAREPGRVFHVERQLPSRTERVAQRLQGPIQVQDDLSLIGLLVQLDVEHQGAAVDQHALDGAARFRAA